jgi:hypothetical protein
MTNISLVGRSTGRSPAFAPLRILSSTRAACRATSASLTSYVSKASRVLRVRVWKILGSRFEFAAPIIVS